MSSRIEQIIGDIEDYIADCKIQPLSGGTKIIVNKEEIEELIGELRAKIPDEIKRYQKIISNKEAILADARSKADQIIAQAQFQTTELISEHQIMQHAYAQAQDILNNAAMQAQEIVNNAQNDANNLRLGAMMYTDDKLRELEDLLTNSLDTSRARYENLINSLQGYLDIVSANRAEFAPKTEEPENLEQEPDNEDAMENEIDLSVVNVSENTDNAE